MGGADSTESQTTYHETDIISYFVLVAMGDANITNELGDLQKIIKSINLLGKNQRAYLGREGIDDIRGQRFSKLKKHYYRELRPR
jgi:hypothetical protein